MGRVFCVTWKEFIQTFRDRRMVAIIFIAPILQLFIFGYAVTNDVGNINVGVMDLDRSEASVNLIDAFSRTRYFTFQGMIAGDHQLKEALHQGTIDMALVIPRDYGKSITAGQQVELQVIYDASDSNFAQIAGGYTTALIGRINQEITMNRLAEKAREQAYFAQTQSQQNMASQQIVTLTQTIVDSGKQQPQPSKSSAPEVSASVSGAAMSSAPIIVPAVRVWYNPELVSAYYMVPGVICMILLIITMLLTGLAITREREIGTIEQIVVSPIKRWEFILGKMLPFAILGMIDVALITIVGTAHFGVPIRGSLVLLFGSAALFLFSALGLGLLLSTISATQQQAMFSNFMFIMPAILLSGFMFPIENMPEAVQLLTYLNPLRYFLVIIRGIFLKGNGLDVLWPQLVALAVFGTVIFSLATARFSKSVG